jgi:hypothetical protein
MTKGEIFGFIINKLESVGWENISSNKRYTGSTSSTVHDGAIMYSASAGGGKNIFIRLSPHVPSSSTAYTSSVDYDGNHIGVEVLCRSTQFSAMKK